MTALQTLWQQVDELEERLKSLENTKVNPNLNYNELHRILEDVALVYKGQRLPTSERPPKNSYDYDDGQWIRKEEK